MKEYLTFDDVLLLPQYSEVDLQKVDLSTNLTSNINLNIPFLSAAMDTVTESKMAISMALNGGIGVIHKNLTIEEQVNEVKKVKNYNEFVNTPVYRLNENETVVYAKFELEELNISSVVITDDNNKVVGLVTLRDLKYYDKDDTKLKDILKNKEVIVGNIDDSIDTIKEKMYTHKVSKLPLLNENGELVAITSLADINKAYKYSNKVTDKNNKLLCAAAVSTSSDVEERVDSLVVAGIDMIVIDSAHGNSKNVINVVQKIRTKYPKIDIVAGNVVTPDAVENLYNAGANIIKVGIGSGSICTTRIISGVGVPQLSAVIECVKKANEIGAKIIADGGIKYSGDIAKALAAGAHAVMLGSLLAGHEEAPGDVIYNENKKYKSYIGMGSMKAMKKGGGDRYFQSNTKKYVPEGVESLILYKGLVDDTLYQLSGGLRASLGYNGASNLVDFANKAEFIKITSASRAESHPHSLDIISSAPNYK